MSVNLALCFVFVCVAGIVAQDAQEWRIVQTAQGPVKGYKSASNGLFEFFGIPYATAPTGRDRFKAPLPGPVWMTPLEAVETDICCPQAHSPYIQKARMTENCLIANVYVPDTEAKDLPVVVYVHGGGYVMGYGTMISPSVLVQSKKFIAVSFNYRLGAHGFLCLGTEGAPGNAGMKDQVALLRWVRENIANFGGNPNDVTIDGNSAGSSAVDLLMLSEMAKGLFHKVIPESGASVSPWSVQLDPIFNAQDFAKTRNFTNVNDLAALENFYKSASFDALVEETLMRDDSSLHFTPCIERDLGEERFLKDAPIDILKSGNFPKVPVLTGFTNMEGLFALTYFEARKNRMNENFADFLPADLQFRSEEEKLEIAKVVKEFYFGDEPVSEKTVQGYLDYFSDVLFAYSQTKSAKLQVEAGSKNVFLYQYSYFSPFSKDLFPELLKDIRGAGHCYQTVALFGGDFTSYFIDDDSDDYKKMRETLREIWANFIITGKPVPEGSNLPEWLPLSADGSPYMDLGQEITLKHSLLKERSQFWDKIYNKYYRTPMPPTAINIRTEL